MKYTPHLPFSSPSNVDVQAQRRSWWVAHAACGGAYPACSPSCFEGSRHLWLRQMVLQLLQQAADSHLPHSKQEHFQSVPVCTYVHQSRVIQLCQLMGFPPLLLLFRIF